MLKLGAEQAIKEQRAVDKRRDEHEERRQRILNAKARTIGVDKEALDAQIQLKKDRERRERDAERAYHQQQLAHEAAALAAEEDAERIRREERRRLAEFWRTEQRPHMRKDYDLSNPHALRHDRPALEAVSSSLGGSFAHGGGAGSGVEPGPASLQRFEGEDGSASGRANAQKAQLRDWTRQQVAERQARLDAERAEERAYQLQQLEAAKRAEEMEAAAEAARREMARRTAEYNRALARQRKEKERDAAIDEACDAAEEIKATLESDTLTENPDRALGAGGKTVREHYKGMSPAELAAIRAEQEAQMEERARLRGEADRKEREWEAYNRAVSKAVAKAEVEVQREKDRERQAHLADLKRQQEEKRERDARLARENTNQPSNEFFAAFGKSAR